MDSALRSRSALEGERKPVTVLFCDIVDSTPMAESLGAERMHKLLSAFFSEALAQVHRYEGTINQFLGDGFMALFGAPITHEDHARRAILAALAIRDANEASRPDGDPPLRLRMGLNSGMVVVGKIGDNLRMDYTAIGDTTNVAARLQHEAQPGTILVSDGVARTVGAYAVLESLGLRQLKGKSEALAVHSLIRLRHADAGRQGPMLADTVETIGRSAEIAALRELVDQAAAGTGGYAGVVGDAGMGKSRLLDEARWHALHVHDGRMHWVRGQCLSFGRTLSYWPFREAIRQCFDMHDDDAEAAAFGKLHAGMARLFGTEADALLPFVAALLALTLPPHLDRQLRALDALAIGHQISRAALKLFERLAQRTALVVAFEDWHWADASSADLLEHLLPLSRRVPLLFLVAMRPETQGSADSLRRATGALELADARCREFILAPLPRQQGTQLIDRLLGGDELPGRARDMLLGRSGGNPFYLGELVRALIATRGIEHDALSGAWEITERFDSVPLPDTIQGVILARIDRLDDEAKQTLKAAAVVGRSFIYRILEAITSTRSTLDGDLAKLRLAALIDEKTLVPELEYVFTHPLIQQATYDSMVEDRRRQLHQQVAECIEQLFGGRLEHYYSILAYHFASAQDWPKARQYLALAADHADRLAADAEALELYEAVIAIAQRHSAAGLDPLHRAQLDAKIGDAHFRAGRHEKALQQFALTLGRFGERAPRSRLLLRGAVTAGLLGYMLRRFWFAGVVAPTSPMSAQHTLCCEVLEASALVHFFTEPLHSVYDSLRIAALSRGHPISRAHIFSLSLIGMTFTALGFYRSAEWCLNRGGELAKRYGEPWQRAMVDHFQAMRLHHIGASARAAKLAAGAADICWQAGNIRLWAAVIGTRIAYLYALGDPDWIVVSQSFWRVVSETSDRQAQAWALTALAMTQEHGGDFDTALDNLQRAIEIFESIPDWRFLAHALGVRSTILLRMRQLISAQVCVDQAVSLIRRHHLSGCWTTRPLLAAAEVRLASFEFAEPAQRDAARKVAGKAIDDMLRHGRRVRDEGAVEARRVAGTYAWLAGRHERARAHWEAGLETARALGARHAEARVLLERGLRSSNVADLTLAEAMFAAAQATHEQGAAQKVLRALRP